MKLNNMLIGILLTISFPQIYSQNFYLHPNGVTCMCPNAAIGDTGTVNGVIFTKRTREQITLQNASTTCTSGITDMNFLFSGSTFNADINTWDVSTVTSMRDMFWSSNFNQSIINWDVSSVTDMSGMFGASSFNKPIGNWNVSSVKNMSSMFRYSQFNQPISDWDVSDVTDMSLMFQGATFNKPIGDWDVKNVTTMYEMFSYSQFNQPIGDWDVSNVTYMEGMFRDSQFNQPIGDWDVINVINMEGMFANSPFNQPIQNWNVSNVTNLRAMFAHSPFNQPIENWDVSNVTIMSGMFWNSSFNQPIENWDVSNVTNMSEMFLHSQFNQPIGEWNVSNVLNMSRLFSGSKFNQPIGDWDVSNVTNMQSMFSISQFNQPIGDWDVSNVTDMSNMFYESQFNLPIGDWNVGVVTNMSRMFDISQFNQPIDDWDVGNVTNMSSMFNGSQFDQPIGNWNVSNVLNMSSMFSGSQFDQPIGNWDVSNVTNMQSMFDSQFNQPIGDWDVSNVTDMSGMFWGNHSFNQNISSWVFNPSVIFSSYFNGLIRGSNFSVENYDLLLQTFSNQNLQNKDFPAYDLVYCNSIARNDLINNKGWTISGDSNSPTAITAPNNLFISADQGSCSASNVNLGFPSTQSCQDYTISNNAPETYPLGQTQVIWTLTDINGTTISDIQSVIVSMEVDEGQICYVSSDDSLPLKNRIFISDTGIYNVKHYEVLRETSSNEFQQIGILLPGLTSFLDSTSNNSSQTYSYRVSTIDICDRVSLGSPTHSTILLQSNISISNTVNLNWTTYHGLFYDVYKIYRKENSGNFDLIAILSSNTNVFNDIQANVLENTYEYYVSIEVPPCDSSNSKNSNAEIKSNKALIGPDAIADDLTNKTIIHPNPILNTLNILLPTDVAFISGNIYNTFGQQVMSVNSTSFSVAHLAPASYYIKILTSKGPVTKIFVKFLI